MTKRVCREKGCPALVDATAYRGRCVRHQQAYEAQRGTRQQRGYDADHERARSEIVAHMNAGEIILCWSCEKPLTPSTLRLDHTADRTGYRGPACDLCNSRIAGQAAHYPQGRGANPTP